MTGRLRIYLADLAHDFRANHFCTPLGVAFVAEYLRNQFSAQVDVRLFKSPARLIEALDGEPAPDIVGLSNYSWNQELNRHLERRIAARHPGIVLIQGGPHIRISDEGIREHLTAHPEVDYYVMFEGEYPTAALIRHFLEIGKPLKARNCSEAITGVAYLAEGRLIYSPRDSKKGELAAIPSPYLSGTMDEFLANPLYLPLIETNRGCPFACTFCAWGISVLNKVRRFDLDRIVAEIDYIAERSPASHWYFTDANFGMFERDVEIAHALRRAADRSPHLRRISINWAKNSSRHCTEIAHILKGICDPLVAVQSTDAKVLKEIKRDNIRMSTITDLVAQARADKIAMTTDVLAGLPEETLESHFATLRDVFAIGFESFNVGQIRMLPGSEMETPEDRARFGLKTRFRMIAGSYGIYDGEPVCEYEESIVQTNAMTAEDMFTLRLVHFLAWALWNSGLAQPLMRSLFKAEGINPLDAILAIIRCDTLHPRVAGFIEEYKAEARTEWFDSAEELIGYFKANHRELLTREYMKLNLKYLGKLLLDRELASLVLDVVASASGRPVARELAQFCLDRILFMDGMELGKEVRYSRELVAALAAIYPTVSAGGTQVCRYSLDAKQLRAVENELKRFSFEDNPVRAVALTLQNYGDKMMFDFAFGEEVERTGRETFLDSFDYADQLNTYAAPTTADTKSRKAIPLHVRPSK